jgi:integrase
MHAARPARSWRNVGRFPPQSDRVGYSDHVRFRGYLPVHWCSGLQPPCLRFAAAVTGRHARLGTRLLARQVDFDQAWLWVRRLKNGHSVEQPIADAELRAIKGHLGSRSDAVPWLFISERGQPLTRQSVNYLMATAETRAGLPPVRPHMLRHSCGYYLANRGYDLRLIQDYLGHRDPRYTVHYTRTAANRFDGLWRS